MIFRTNAGEAVANSYSGTYTIHIMFCLTDGAVLTTLVRKVVASVLVVFFEQSKLSLQQWVVIIHWWVREYPVTKAKEEAKTSEVTAIQYLRDICSWRLMTLDSPLLIGGQGVVIQIDESLFRHKPKVK